MTLNNNINIQDLSFSDVNLLAKRIREEQEKHIGFTSPFLWTEDEIHDLVMKEVGSDTLFPRGFNVLIKIWSPPKEYDSGLVRTDHSRRNESITTRIGKILRMGNDAFRDPSRFPSGPLVTYGEWGIFRASERELMNVNDMYLATVHDDRFIMATTDPANVKTTFDLEFEHNG